MSWNAGVLSRTSASSATPVPLDGSDGEKARRPHRRGARSSAGVAIVVAAVLILGACGSSTSDDDAGPAGTGAEKSAIPNDTTASTSGPDSPTPAFETGLAALWSDSNSTTLVVLPSGLAGCVYPKLPAGDITVISAMKVPADSEGVPDATGIRVFKASAECDKPGVAAMFATQLGLDDLGFTPTEGQNACVATDVLDAVILLDDQTATGTEGEALKVPFATALQACVPIHDFLVGALQKEGGGIPPEAIECIATEGAKTITWADVVNNSATIEPTISAAAQACAVTGT